MSDGVLVYAERIDPWQNMAAAHKTFQVALEASQRGALFLDCENSSATFQERLDILTGKAHT